MAVELFVSLLLKQIIYSKLNRKKKKWQAFGMVVKLPLGLPASHTGALRVQIPATQLLVMGIPEGCRSSTWAPAIPSKAMPRYFWVLKPTIQVEGNIRRRRHHANTVWLFKNVRNCLVRREHGVVFLFQDGLSEAS